MSTGADIVHTYVVALKAVVSMEQGSAATNLAPTTRIYGPVELSRHI